jgi:hypothetical protein
MTAPARKTDPYAELAALPSHVTGEVTKAFCTRSHGPALRHARAASVLGEELGPPFKRGRGGPGGWIILDEPELHLGPRPDVLVPDLAGWRRERPTVDCRREPRDSSQVVRVHLLRNSPACRSAPGSRVRAVEHVAQRRALALSSGAVTATSPRLVFIEGMPGAGKTTTAKHLAQWLPEQGVATRCYLEMADDNPIRTPGVDAMRFRHPQVRPLPDTDETGFARDHSVYAVEQWGRLARRACVGGEVLVLESRYIQNSVLAPFLDGASRESIVESFREVAAQLEVAAPLLVYLRPEDVRSHWQHTFDARPGPWVAWVVGAFSRSRWAQARGVSGPEAIFTFYETWEAITLELCELHRGPLLLLRDPQRDWAEAYARLHGALTRA